MPVVRLTEVFRQAAQSRIITSAHRINQGSIPDLSPPETQNDFYFVQAEDPETADDVKPLVLELLRQNSGLTVRVNELLAQNKALLARIAELEAKHGKPPKTPENSSLPPSRGQQGEHRGADAGEESPRRPSGRGASARRGPGRDTRHLRRALRVWRRARRGRPGTREGPGPC